MRRVKCKSYGAQYLIYGNDYVLKDYTHYSCVVIDERGESNVYPNSYFLDIEEEREYKLDKILAL